jgi:tetratricopeptide (TPR) repeat protein
MLETIREYARQRLEAAGSTDALRRRYLGHFVQLAEVAEPELWAQQYGERLRELDAEEANFRSALDWAIQQGDELALRLAGSLYPFWEIRAQHREARAWLTQALALGDDTAPPARAKALIAAGRATAWQFDWPAAIVLLEDAAALSRELDDTEGVGRCLGFIGHARLFMGDSQGAAAALTGAVELARGTGDLGSLARALYNAAFAPIEQRNFDRAGAMFEEAAAISRAEDMSLLHALSLLHLGYTAILAGDPELAAMRLDETADLLDDLGKTMWSPVAQRYRALLALLGGKIDDASSLLRASLVQAREEGPQQDLPNWMEEIAAIAAARGDGRRAATLWGATEAMFEKRGLQVREENRQVRERFADDLDRSLAGDLSAAAREDGRAMTLEQAVEYALASID